MLSFEWSCMFPEPDNDADRHSLAGLPHVPPHDHVAQYSFDEVFVSGSVSSAPEWFW